MAYQNASASDPNDLLDQLRLFLLGAGWTVDAWSESAGARTLRVSKAGLFASFRVQLTGGYSADPTPYIITTGHSGLDGGVPLQESPSVFTNAMGGPYIGYDFFEGVGADGPYIHVVVEIRAGQFRHFGTGVLNKEGAITTGQYVHGTTWYMDPSQAASYISNPDSFQHRLPFDNRGNYAWGYVRADYDGASPQWLDGRMGAHAERTVLSGYSGNATWTSYDAAPLGLASRASPSALTGRTPLWPLWCMGERASNLFSPLGYPPDMRYVRMDHFNPKDVLTLGADEWKVFPAARKNGILGEPNSGTYGYAYRVNA